MQVNGIRGDFLLKKTESKVLEGGVGIGRNGDFSTARHNEQQGQGKYKDILSLTHRFS